MPSSSAPDGSTGARVLYPTGDRSSQPAGALQSANLLPDMLTHNLRAGLFPEKGQRIRNTIEQGLARQAWFEVAAIEQLHKRQCPNSTLKHIHTVQPTNDAAPSLPPSPPADPTSPPLLASFTRPLPTRLYASLFREQSLPHLDIARPTPLPSAVSGGVALPAPASGRVDARSGLVYYGARELGSELWTVDRCSVEQQYLVSYYGDGDAFYATVYPVNWSGAFDCLRVKAKRWLGFS